jgi:hypothetical protein
VNAQDKFGYSFPHPQFLWYLGYRIGGKYGTKEEKWQREHWLHIGMGGLVDICNLGTVRYRFVVQFNLGMRMLRLGGC